MWPYTECEWNYITHGKRKRKKDNMTTLLIASIIPSLILITLLSILL